MSIRDQFAHYLDGWEPDPEIVNALDTDDEPASSYLRSSMLEALRALDPEATLSGFASIRLIGARFENGLFNAAAAEIFQRLDKEVRAAAPAADAENLVIGFKGVLAGSVLLPLEPMGGVGDLAEGEMAVLDRPPLETALQRVLDLHDNMENGTISVISRDLGHSLRMLVDELEKAEADLEVNLASSTGHRRTSRLTAAGRGNARRMFQKQLEVKREVVTGILAGISLDEEFARLELRATTRRRIDVHRVPSQVAKSLVWDALLRIEVRSEETADQFGGQKGVEHQYLRLLTHEDPLPPA